MVNKIYILDSKKINDSTYIITLIKKYNITLLYIFPKVLELLIQEYVDDIVEVIINDHDIIVDDQYINYHSISFSFHVDYTKQLYINCEYISSNIINVIASYYTQYTSMWHIISNMYLQNLYNMKEFYDTRYSCTISYQNNTFTYDNVDVIKIVNHKLFKNICIMMCTLIKYVRKKLKL